MQITIPTSINSAQVSAASRHLLSFVMGGIAFASITHIISGDDANAITGALNQIATGVSSVVAGLATLVTIGTAWYSAYLKTTQNQIAAAAANPAVASIVVTTQPLADAIPSPKVVSQ